MNFHLSEGEDFRFSSSPPEIIIPSGTNRGCLTIDIIPSALVEGLEVFNLAISGLTQAVIVEGNTTVVIAADEGM